jgi:hypothetical protein
MAGQARPVNPDTRPRCPTILPSLAEGNPTTRLRYGLASPADGLAAAQGPGRRAGRTNGPAQGRRPQDVAGPATARARPALESTGDDAAPGPMDPGVDSHGKRRQALASQSGEAPGRPQPSQPADRPSGAAPWWRTPDRTWHQGRADARLEPGHTGSSARWESPPWRWPPSVRPDRPRPARRLGSRVERRGAAGRCHSQHPAPRRPGAGSDGQVARLSDAQERTGTAAARCPHRCWPGGRTGSRSAFGRS